MTIYKLRQIPNSWDYDPNTLDWDELPKDPISKNLLENCQIFSIHSKEDALNYVQEVLDSITDSQRIELIRIYFNISTEQSNKYNINSINKIKNKTKQVGGVANKPDYNDPIYKLLEMADSQHDFRLDTYLYLKNTLKYDIPKEIDTNIIKNEDNFISKVSNSPELTFINSKVANPLYGFSIKHYDLKDRLINYPESTFIELINSQNKSLAYHRDKNEHFVNLELWTQYKTTPKNRYYEARQLAYLCQFIKMWFLNHDFLVDNSHTVTQLILLVKYIDNAFYIKFSNDIDVKTYLWDIITDNQKEKIDWKMSITDTNIYDGTIFWQREIDYIHSTGYVYGGSQPESNDIFIGSIMPFDMQAYLELDGYEKNDYKDLNLKIRVEIVQENNIVFNEILNMEQCKWLFSKKCLAEVIRAKGGNNIASIRDELDDIIYENPRFIDLVVPHLETFYRILNIEMLYKLKRTADYSHIEHCKQYNKVFVTKDKLAALYAYYRKVPFIYMPSENQALNDSKKYLPNENPSFLQINHILYRP